MPTFCSGLVKTEYGTARKTPRYNRGKGPKHSFLRKTAGQVYQEKEIEVIHTSNISLQSEKEAIDGG